MFVKAIIEVERSDDIEVMFNPNEYNIDVSTNYAAINVPGLDGPITQFISGNQDTLSMQLMFNTYKPPKYNEEEDADGMEDVSDYTSEIYNLTIINEKIHRPPICTFKWGSLSFSGIVSDVHHKFTMFLKTGKPVRALVDVTFKSVLDVQASKKASPWESPDRTKYRKLDESSSLWQLAYDEYNDADKWKVIARANGICNPLDIEAGMEIVLPPIKP